MIGAANLLHLLIFTIEFSYKCNGDFMKYEVKEKKFFSLLGIKEIININSNLKHLETTFDLEKYELEIVLNYLGESEKEVEVDFVLPVEFATSMTETLTAELIELKHSLIENNGVEFEFAIEVDVTEIVEEKEEIKEEIKESYQLELEEIFLIRNEEEVIEESKFNIDSIDDNIDFVGGLNTAYTRYKVISLDEDNLNKISVQYNMPINYLYELKKQNNKVIVHDKE